MKKKRGGGESKWTSAREEKNRPKRQAKELPSYSLAQHFCFLFPCIHIRIYSRCCATYVYPDRGDNANNGKAGSYFIKQQQNEKKENSNKNEVTTRGWLWFDKPRDRALAYTTFIINSHVLQLSFTMVTLSDTIVKSKGCTLILFSGSFFCLYNIYCLFVQIASRFYFNFSFFLIWNYSPLFGSF